MPQQPTPAVAPDGPDAAAAAAQMRTDMQAMLRAAEAQSPAAVTPPRSAREVEGLNVRRDMLRQQLERTTERRQELSNELRRVGDNTDEGQSPDPAAVAALRAGLEVRLRDVDARTLQLERDIAATDRALTQAGPEVLAQYEQQRPREPVRQGPTNGEVVGISAVTFFAGMMLMLLGGRLRRWRRRRAGRVERGEGERGAGPDPRIDRLTHAVDAIAVEVERIGEGQRFVTQLLAEARPAQPALTPEVGRSFARDGDQTLDAPAAR